MKLKLLGGVALAAACAASGSWAEDGWYGAIDAGVHQPRNVVGGAQTLPAVQIKTDNEDAIVFGKIGYRFSPWIRLEFEGGVRPAELKGASILGGSRDYVCGGNSTLAYSGEGGFSGTCTRPTGH